MPKLKNPYTLADCACYVDGARGIYVTDKIVSIARQHGAKIEHAECCDSDAPTNAAFPSEFAECPFADEYEQEADDYMNDHFSVDGAYWGRNENGDWGLWQFEDTD